MNASHVREILRSRKKAKNTTATTLTATACVSRRASCEAAAIFLPVVEVIETAKVINHTGTVRITWP